MARTKIKAIYDMTPETKRELMAVIGAMHGLYEVKLIPRADKRSLKQNSTWFSMIVTPLYQYLREQDVDVNDVLDTHEMLKEHLLRVPVFNRRTGEIVGSRTLSTSDMSKDEFSEMFERARVWLNQNCGIVVPDPNPMWRVTRELEAA